jgi:hypothetical protein
LNPTSRVGASKYGNWLNQEITMNLYQPSTPRVMLSIAATAMTIVTIGVLVVLPSRMEPDSRAYAMFASARAAAAPCIDVTPRKCNASQLARGAVADHGMGCNDEG